MDGGKTAVQVRLVLEHSDGLPEDDEATAKIVRQLVLGRRVIPGTAHAGLVVIREATDVRVLGAPGLADPVARELGPFARESSTSRRAALDNWPRQGSQRHRIIEALYRAYRGELTRDGLAVELELQHQSIDPRVLELIRGGWVVETPREKPTRTGSMAKLLELTPKAREKITRMGGQLR